MFYTNIRKKPSTLPSPHGSIPVKWFIPPMINRISEGGLRAHGLHKLGGAFDNADDQHPPLVSIVTVVLNGSPIIEKTIISVLDQPYKNIEYIIIDGGSTDGTLEILKRYDDAIDYWLSEPDNGIYDAMNKGILLTSGRWVNFINAGDCLLGGLEKLTEYSPEEYCLIQGFTRLTGGRRNYSQLHCPKKSRDFLWNMVYHQSLFYNRTDIMLYDLTYRVIADRVMTCTMIEKSEKKIGLIKDFVCSFDTHGFSSQSIFLSSREYLRALRDRKEYLRMIVVVANCFMAMLHKKVEKTEFYAKYRTLKDYFNRKCTV